MKPAARDLESSAGLSQHELIRKELREDILGGTLEVGQRLSPSLLGARFGVSTMPVREALRLLQEEGLIEVAPRKWTRVSSPDPRLADEVYPVVAVLEEFAIASAPGVPLESIVLARDANHQLAQAAATHDVLGCVRADGAFHDALIGLSLNATLVRTIHDLKARIRLLESIYYRADDARESVKQHEAMLEALVQQDMAAAGRIVAENWHQGHSKLRNQIINMRPGT